MKDGFEWKSLQIPNPLGVVTVKQKLALASWTVLFPFKPQQSSFKGPTFCLYPPAVTINAAEVGVWRCVSKRGALNPGTVL